MILRISLVVGAIFHLQNTVALIFIDRVVGLGPILMATRVCCLEVGTHLVDCTRGVRLSGGGRKFFFFLEWGVFGKNSRAWMERFRVRI